MECQACKLGIVVSDLPIQCVGQCAGVFHHKCTTLTRSVAKLITENENVLYKCTDCLSSQCCDEQSVSVSDAKTMGEVMKQLSSVADSITGIRNNVAAQIDIALKAGMENLRLNVNDLLEKIICEKLNSMKNSFSGIKADEKLAATNDLRDTHMIHSESDQMRPKRKKRKFQNSDNDSNDEVFQEKPSFADVLKRPSRISTSKSNNNSNKPNNRKTRPVIVIKPKESKQACEDTRKFLKTKLDPKTHKISNFRNGKDGSIIVECATGDNVNVVKNGIESSLGESYSAVVPTSVPRLKIVGMSDQYSSDVFIDYLKSQNEDIEIKDVKVINMFENPRFTYNKFSVVIEVDVDTYKCLLCAKNVNVGFDRCLIVPAINVLRCFKCGEFGHKSMDCKNCERCSKCSHQHNTSECTSTVLKCVNCLKTNKERKMNLDVNHAAFSSECLIYKRLFDQKKSSLRFNK